MLSIIFGWAIIMVCVKSLAERRRDELVELLGVVAAQFHARCL
jgi:hypothetical protein